MSDLTKGVKFATADGSSSHDIIQPIDMPLPDRIKAPDLFNELVAKITAIQEKHKVNRDIKEMELYSIRFVSAFLECPSLLEAAQLIIGLQNNQENSIINPNNYLSYVVYIIFVEVFGKESEEFKAAKEYFNKVYEREESDRATWLRMLANTPCRD